MLSSTPDEASKYERVLALMQYQVELLWLIFGAFLLAETVLLAAIGSMMEAGRELWLFGAAALGLALTVPWWASFCQNHSYYLLRVAQAKQFEPAAGDFLTEGGMFAEGNPVRGLRMPFLARLLPPRRGIALLVIVFALAFLSIAITYAPWPRAGYWEQAFAPALLVNWLLAVFGVGGLIVAVSTLKRLTEQTRAAVDAASAAKTSADAVMLAERGYVSISHHPPGIDIDDAAVTQAGEEDFGGWHDVTFRFGIANNGNTPARITDISMNHHVGPPADIPPPPSAPGTGERLFLVKGDTVHDVRHFRVRNVDRNQLGLTLRLWMLGYADYIDAFGIRRRAGYARFYDPSLDQRSAYEDSRGVVDQERFRKRNNLPFITQPGYNYDRTRRRGEGNDWDEPSQ